MTDEAGEYRCEECGADSPDHFCKNGIKWAYKGRVSSIEREGPLSFASTTVDEVRDNPRPSLPTPSEAEDPDPGIHQHGNLPPPACTQGGEHCFCVGVPAGGGKEWCCWCGDNAGYWSAIQPVPGHGKFRTELKRE